jgi:polyhydroxybutyrate depolymerase
MKKEATYQLTEHELSDWPNRPYEVYAPVVQTGPASLIMNVHGGYSNSDLQATVSQMNQLAQEQGFIVVYPNGTAIDSSKPGQRFWNDGRPNSINPPLPDDVAYIRAVMAAVETKFKVSQNKLMCGFSNGATMTYRIAKESPELFSAYAAVATIVGPHELGEATGKPPILHIDGLKDQISLWDGNTTPNAPFDWCPPAVVSTVQEWAAFYGYRTTPTLIQSSGAATLWQYGQKFKVWRIGDGGHCWPGGKILDAMLLLNCGPQSNAINASQEIWKWLGMWSK